MTDQAQALQSLVEAVQIGLYAVAAMGIVTCLIVVIMERVKRWAERRNDASRLHHENISLKATIEAGPVFDLSYNDVNYGRVICAEKEGSVINFEEGSIMAQMQYDRQLREEIEKKGGSATVVLNEKSVFDEALNSVVFIKDYAVFPNFIEFNPFEDPTILDRYVEKVCGGNKGVIEKSKRDNSFKSNRNKFN